MSVMCAYLLYLVMCSPDPVSDSEGNSFERAAIEHWLRVQSVSPLTRTPMQASSLVPNRALKAAIDSARGLQLQVTSLPANFGDFIGQEIALYNSANSGFVQMTDAGDGGAMGVLPWARDTPRVLEPWRNWERFLVVDGGNGKVCLFNLHHRRFVRVMGEDVNGGGGVRAGPDDLPGVESWPSERFTVVDGGNGTLAFHNAHHNRFMRLFNGHVDARAGVKSIADFPVTWSAERFEIVKHSH